jgi:hypothetical protein
MKKPFVIWNYIQICIPLRISVVVGTAVVGSMKKSRCGLKRYLNMYTFACFSCSWNSRCWV